MRVRYLGKNLGATGFTNNKEYEVLEIDKLTGALRIIDDSEEDYLYSPTKPSFFDGTYTGGRFEVVEDDAKGSLSKAIYGNVRKINASSRQNIYASGN